MILVHSKQKTPDEVEAFVKAWDGKVPIAIATLRGRRGREALALLRKGLDELPEVEHPLGL